MFRKLARRIAVLIGAAVPAVALPFSVDGCPGNVAGLPIDLLDNSAAWVDTLAQFITEGLADLGSAVTDAASTLAV